MRFGRSSARSGRLPARLAALPPTGEIPLGSITLHNTGASAIMPRARFGIAWRRGRFPATHRLHARVAGGAEVAFAAVANRNRWGDGSLKTTADGGVVLHDTTPLSPGAFRTYELFAAPGAQATSGFDPWAWIDAHANDFTVEVTSRTGSQTGAMSDLTFSLKAAIATAARREIVADTARFVRVKVWQLPAGEGHLVCEWHLDFWLDGSGTPVAIEWCTVMCLDWYVADPLSSGQPKQRQNYNATVRYGSTVVDTRTGLQHAYHCRWASLRSANDHQHARKHWINLSGNDPLPTIRVEYSLSTLREIMRAGAAPPIRQDIVPSLTSDATYTPLSTQNHRAVINGTGAYAGRGVWSAMDCELLIHQSGGGSRNPNRAWRNARVNAQAGLAAFFHQRDHRTVDGAIRRRVIPWPMRQITGGTQTYQGLGTPVVFSRTSISSPAPYSTLTWTEPNGGFGAFSSYDASHAVDYSGPVAFLEGEHYLGDAARSHLGFAVGYIHFNGFAHDGGLRYEGTVRGNSWGVPTTSTRRDGQGLNMRGQTREGAWGINVLRAAIQVTDDRMPEWPLFINEARRLDKWMTDSWSYFPASYRTRGITFLGHNASTVQIWQVAFWPQVCYVLHRLIHDELTPNVRGFASGVQETAVLDGRFFCNLLTHTGPYAAGVIMHSYALDTEGLNPYPTNYYPMQLECDVTSNVFRLRFLGFDNVNLPGWYVTNGDVLYVALAGYAGATNNPLAPLAHSTPYYIVNASGDTFQISATPGGSPITGIATGSMTVDIAPQVFKDRTTVGPSGTFYWPPGDSYLLIAHACYEAMRGNGHPDYTSSLQSAWATFMAPWFSNPSSPFAPWLWDGGLLAED